MKVPAELLREMAKAAGPPPTKRRPQFRLRSLFWLTAIGAVLSLAFPLLWERIRPWLEPRGPKPQVVQPSSPFKSPGGRPYDNCIPCGSG